jgi:hypothetical protein
LAAISDREGLTTAALIWGMIVALIASPLS